MQSYFLFLNVKLEVASLRCHFMSTEEERRKADEMLRRMEEELGLCPW